MREMDAPFSEKWCSLDNQRKQAENTAQRKRLLWTGGTKSAQTLRHSGKCCEGKKRCCYFHDFIPCFHSSSVRSQTQEYSMNTTCLHTDSPQVTAGATVPGVSAALSVEEVRGQDLVSGNVVQGLYPHHEDAACCPLQLLLSSLLLEDNTDICWWWLRFSQERVAWNHKRIVLLALSCLILHVLNLRLVTWILDHRDVFVLSCPTSVLNVLCRPFQTLETTFQADLVYKTGLYHTSVPLLSPVRFHFSEQEDCQIPWGVTTCSVCISKTIDFKLKNNHQKMPQQSNQKPPSDYGVSVCLFLSCWW